ncbi:MAG: phosphoglycerate kinase [Burkholderiales bacterium]|nr:MAG: phosphoglycerate kinase [Burkholderiales bacterium]
MKLWLLRHARVQLPGGLCYGASDVPADPELTLAAARHWAPQLPGEALWRVSGLGRAQQLARAIRSLRPAWPVPVIDARLNEMDFGRWELAPWDRIARRDFDDWMLDFAHHRFGGAESTQMLIDRVAQALTEQRRAAPRQAVWVTHAGVIRAVCYLARGGTLPIPGVGHWPREAPEPGGGLCLDV